MFLNLDNNNLNSQGCDKWILQVNDFQVYNVKSIYNILNEGVLGEDEYKTFWKIKAFILFQCWFGEFYLIGYLPRITYILDVQLSNRLFTLCEEKKESLGYLFLTCSVITLHHFWL